MFLLFGMRPVTAVVLVVTFVCGHCDVSARQRVTRRQQKVTLFFIPVLSLRTSWFVECTNCGRSTSLTKEQAAHSLEWAASRGQAV